MIAGFLTRSIMIWLGRLTKDALIRVQVRGHLASVGTPIGSYDLLIAAITLAHNLTLATHNTREVERVKGCRLSIGRLRHK